MATKPELERLAVVETKQDRANQDINEVKNDVKELLIRFDNLDKRYVTRTEVAILKWVVATLIVAVGTLATWIGGK